MGFSHIYLKEATFRLTFDDRKYIDDILSRMQEEVIEIDHYRIKDVENEACFVVLTVLVEEKKDVYEIYKRMIQIDYIYEVDLLT